MFSRLGIMTALVQSYVKVSGLSNMVAYNRKYLRNNVYLCLVTMHDRINIGIAVGISLLSCVQAELQVISYPLPVTSRHL